MVFDKNPAYYFVIFMYGYAIKTDPGFEAGIQTHKDTALLAAILICAASYIIQNAGLNTLPLGYELGRIVSLMSLFIPWLLLVAILGYGKIYLNANNNALVYAGRAAYPVYLLHQTIILAIAFAVVPLRLPAGFKFALICIPSSLATLAIYHIFVKRIHVCQILFGLK